MVAPVALMTERLLLDQPGMADVDLIARYCIDPVFELYMTTPWPYEREHATDFVRHYVVDGWASGREYTWAIRHSGEFVGILGYRTGRGDIGFWIGAPHRGHGYMPEAVGAVADWLFTGQVASIDWFCLVGNTASAAVAQKAGFTFGGVGRSRYASRDGADRAVWQGTLVSGDSREPKPGWPDSAPRRA